MLNKSGPTSKGEKSGPLHGLKIVEFTGLGPAPFCSMMLSDMGAEVIRIDQKRKAGAPSTSYFSEPKFDVLARGRRSLALDLKSPQGIETVLRLIDQADALIEGFRPGVMERLGLGPDICLKRNPRLVYGRMTGWGQTGPLAQRAGHDLNYIALTGALYGVGAPDRPPPVPLNLMGDFGGGAMMLAFGIVCAMLEAQKSRLGQVVDAAMTDGAALLSTLMYAFKADGQWSNDRSGNLLDGGAPFYSTYVCADGKYIAIGPLEPQFYLVLCEAIGWDKQIASQQYHRKTWPELKRNFEALFKMRSRAEWCELLDGTDACFAPVLDWDEAPDHPHNVARETFITLDGVRQPAPAPRFSRTLATVQRPPAAPGEHSAEVLSAWGFEPAQIETLRAAAVI